MRVPLARCSLVGLGWTGPAMAMLLVSATGIACTRQSSRPPEPTPDVQLLLIPGATNITKMAKIVNSAVYDIADEYPATRTISAFDEQFARAGWTVNPDDALNPNVGARMREWIATQRNDHHEIRAWEGQWSHPTLGLAMVNLKYQSEDGQSEGPLRVQALFVPLKTVKFLHSLDRKQLSRQHGR
jgi:hypothetical protein